MPHLSRPKQLDFGRNRWPTALGGEQQLDLDRVWKKGEEEKEIEGPGGTFTETLLRQTMWRGRARPNFENQVCHASACGAVGPPHNIHIGSAGQRG